MTRGFLNYLSFAFVGSSFFFFCAFTNNFPPSFETLKSDCNPCLSFDDIFQWRVCKSMNIFHFYASCHISDIVPCLAFFTLSFSVKYLLPHLASVICCFSNFSAPWHKITAFLNLRWMSLNSFSRPLHCWTRKLLARWQRTTSYSSFAEEFLIWGQRNIYFLSGDLAGKNQIFHRQQPQYLLYKSFPLVLLAFSPRALKKFSFLSSGFSDLAYSDYRVEEF